MFRLLIRVTIMSSGFGFPDYQQYPQWRGSWSSVASANVTSAAPVTFSQNVTAYASIVLIVNCTSGTGVTVKVQFFTDSTMAVALGQFTYVITNGYGLNVIIPASGNFVEVTISTGQSGTQVVSYAIQPTNIAPTVPSYPVPTDYLGAIGLNTAAGATTKLSLSQVCEGIGYSTCNPEAGGAHVTYTVVELGEDGNAKDYLARSVNPAGPVTMQFLAGKNPIQLWINNTGTSTHANDWSLGVQGRSG